MADGAVPARVRWAVEQLDPRPEEHVLEIGCGAGHAVTLLAARVTRGRILAIDSSPTQVGRARQLNRELIMTGRVSIEHASLSEAADAPNAPRFGAILAINVNAFWTTPEQSLTSLVRLLPRGGRACLVYQAPSAPKHEQIRSRVPALMAAHGFEPVELRSTEIGNARLLCIMGECAGLGAGPLVV
jgi:cyclopropane fatty-acyl-phospholipid synthase-like methyltransferase